MSERPPYPNPEQNRHPLNAAATEHPTSEENRTEHRLNPRIQRLMEERDAAERRLQEALLEVETREQFPAFQRALSLFNSGIRLSETGEMLGEGYMTYEITRIGQPAKERLVEHEVLNELLLADDEQDNHRFGVEVMEHLLHLTEEGQ